MTDPHHWSALETPFAAGTILRTMDAEIWFHDNEHDGEPLVLLGGFSPGHFHFDFVRPHLDDHRLLTWEPRGFGPSTSTRPDGRTYTTDTWSNDLERLIVARKLPPVHLWANGFSSYIALQLAATRPELIASVITYTDIWAQDPGKGYDRAWNVYRAILESYGTSGYGAWLLSRFYAVKDPPWFPDWFEHASAQVMRDDTAIDAIGHCLTQADIRSSLPDITVPVLILLGDQSWDGEPTPPTEDAALQLMQTSIPRVTTTVLPAHPIHLIVQRPEAAAAAVRRFIEHV